MSEKVKLPKDVCDALDEAKLHYNREEIIFIAQNGGFVGKCKALNGVWSTDIYFLLKQGYEPEEDAK